MNFIKITDNPYRVIPVALTIAIICLLLLSLTINFALNSIVKPKLLAKVNSSKETQIKIDDISYSIFNGSYSVKNLTVNSSGSDENSDSVFLKINYVSARINLLSLIFEGEFSFPSIIIDKILIKKATSPANDTINNEDTNDTFAFLDSLSKNLHNISAGYVEIQEGNYINKDYASGISDSIINFNLKLNGVLFDSTSSKKLKFRIAEEVEFRAQNFNLNFENIRYKLYFTDFIMNSANGDISVKNFSFRPYMNDANYFKTRRFRTDRFILTIAGMSITDFNFNNFINKQKIDIGNIIIQKYMLDALTNMRLPEDPKASPPDMPNEIIKKLPFTLDIKKMELKNGDIYVKELYPYDEIPGVLQFSKLYTTITNLKNNENVHFDIITKLCGTGDLKVKFDIGLHPGKMEFKYSGELGSMSAPDLNKFISVADRIQVTTGNITKVNFKVTADGDSAIGEATPVYNGLSINKLDKDTGKSSGIILEFKSFLANTFIIKKNNEGNDIESSKVPYVRQSTDAYMEYVWKILRTAIGAVVGFS